MPRKKPIRAEDVYEMRRPAVCRLSPKGDRLATAVTQADREALKNLTHLWMVDLIPPSQGGRGQPALRPSIPENVRQFTFGKHSEQNPRWSPDGRRLAFVSTRSGKSELWVMPADGGEAKQLTKLEGSVSDFTWSPEGRALVVVFTPQDAEAKEREEKKKRGAPGTEAPKVREIKRFFYKLDGAGFLPTGRAHLLRVDAQTGKTRPLASDDRYDESEPVFSPDGKWLYFVSNRSRDPELMFQRIDIWRMPARGGEIEKVRSFDGPSEGISPSPDGRWLVFLGTRDPNVPWNTYHTKLWLIPSSGGRPVCLTERLDRSCTNSTISDSATLGSTTTPVWSPDSQSVFFIVTTEGNSEVWRVGLRERKPEPVVNAPGMVIDFSIDFERGWIHTAWNDLTNPGEIRSFPLPPRFRVQAVSGRGRKRPETEVVGPAARGRGRAGAKAQPVDPFGLPQSGPLEPVSLTGFNHEWIGQREVAEPEEIWTTGKGRHRIQGSILSPRRLNRARKHPGILYIHGGPAAQYGRAFFHEYQVLAAHGYVVFYCNPRGGTGYAERHLNAILNRWGTVDYDDLMDFTDAALREARHVDRRRLAVAGGSYGGFMTNWIIGHTDRFACAITSRSISNLMSFIGSSDFGYAWPCEFGDKGPWDDPAHYLRMSPLSYLSRMKTPTLIEHQEEDHRCPVEQAEQLWVALRLKGVPAEFLRYPGEPHGMSRGGRPDRRIDRLDRILVWLGKWTGRKK